MDFTSILDQLVLVTEHKYFGLVLTAAEQLFPYVAPLVAGFFGAKWGVSAFKRSPEYQFTQDRAYQLWKARGMVALSDAERQQLKDYFNKMTSALFGPPAREYETAIGAFPKAIIAKISKSEMLKAKWQAYYDKMMQIAELYRSEAHANTAAYVSLFKEAKVRWLFFMNSAVAKQYDEEEVVDLMGMGLVQRDIPESAQGDNQKHAEIPFWYYLGED